MHIVISDSFKEVKEIEINKTGDAIYLDIPKERNAETVLKIIKILMLYIFKS